MTAPDRILIADDDAQLSRMLGDYLANEGFRAEAVFDGISAVSAALSGNYDAVILDVMMPGMNGTDALREIRRKSSVPIIMLTAKGDDVDRVVGLELGADDYIAKPYFPREVAARLRAVLRRGARPPAQERGPLTLGPLTIDPANHSAVGRGRTLPLTPSEYKLLIALVRAPDRIVTKEELSLDVLGRPHERYDRSIDVHLNNLRNKVHEACEDNIEIETVRGAGYRIKLKCA